MKKLPMNALLVLLALIIFFACQKDKIETGNNTMTTANEDDHYYRPNLVDLMALPTDRSDCYWIEIPAGSVNALNAAITAACDNGVIYLKAGIHTENAKINISKSVKILGENGAILKLTSTSAPYTIDGNFFINPAIHVVNTTRVLFQNLDIQTTDAEGATAILLQNSNESAVIGCKITNFQVSIVLEKSDRAAIMRNTIVGGSGWQTQVMESIGITVVNGKSEYVSDNEISNTVFGIWACDQWSTCERNNFHDNVEGIILCNVPLFYELPSGIVTGSLVPGTAWKVFQNKSKGNFDNGIMVIDGANQNIIIGNEVTGNGLSPLSGTATDVEIFGQSDIFGFTTPTTHDNYVDLSSSPSSTIRNCSTGNTIISGVLMNGGCR
jgi:nitrous oxidase accessory protein NosD